MTTHHFPIRFPDEDVDEDVDDAECAYCTDLITRDDERGWLDASGSRTCGVAPNMIRNPNGSYYCQDCSHLVILFDEDIHYCAEAWHRITNEGRVAPEDTVWTRYERDEDEEVHRPIMGWMSCIYVFDGVDTDGTRYYRCVVHDDITAGHQVSCETASYQEEV